MEDCIFCKITRGELPSSKVFENDLALGFLDINPVNKGHTLIIPKTHYETIFDVPDNTLREVIVAVKKITLAVKKATNAEGISISQNNYIAAGQAVPHIHFHIMPRFASDGLHNWPQGRYAEKEMEEYRKKIVRIL